MRDKNNNADVMCLCYKCYQDYLEDPETIIKRANYHQRVKERCTKCNRMGFDYIIKKKKLNPRRPKGGSSK
jgi:mRNA interferase MazF